jgi:lipoate-protein ligase A
LAKKWRLIDADLVNPITGVAMVEAVSIARSKKLVPDTLILWRPNTSFVCLGYFQLVREEVYADVCDRLGITIARRILGGGAGYCDQNQILYDAIMGANRIMTPTSSNIERMYRYVLQGVVKGLAELGFDDVMLMPDYNFAIWVNGRKISGNSSTGLNGAQVVGGSLVVEFDYDGLLKVVKNPFKALKAGIESIGEGLTSINRELKRKVEMFEVKDALKKGFEQALKIELTRGTLIDEELELIKELEPKFSSKDWTYSMDIKHDKLMPYGD